MSDSVEVVPNLCMSAVLFLCRDGILPDLPQCSVAFNSLLKVCLQSGEVVDLWWLCIHIPSYVHT